MFDELGLVRQHLDSFNRFIEEGIHKIIQEMDKIEPDIAGYYVKVEGIEIGDPVIREADGSMREIYPMEARIRNLTYAAPLTLRIRPVTVEAGVEHEGEVTEAFIGRLPIMLKSKKCRLHGLSKEELIEVGEDPFDPGGYFIISGSERVIVTQEYLLSNRILVDYSGKSPSSARAKIFSTVEGFRSLVTVERLKDGRLMANFFSIPRRLPFSILMKALGVTSDFQIVQMISNDPEIIQELLPTIGDGAEITSQEAALDYIGKRVAVGQTRDYRILRAQTVLDNYLLPHIGNTEDKRLEKALYLAQMALQVIRLDLGKRQPDDKDHYANKRLKLAGEMLMDLFRVTFRSLHKDIRYQLEKGARRGRIPSLKNAMRADVVEHRIRHALATGNWVGGKAGVSQLLDRMNYMSSYSHLRRVVSPLVRSQAHFEARELHATHWGKICPAETPEGPNCGLVKNLALQARISQGVTDEEKDELMKFLQSRMRTEQAVLGFLQSLLEKELSPEARETTLEFFSSFLENEITDESINTAMNFLQTRFKINLSAEKKQKFHEFLKTGMYIDPIIVTPEKVRIDHQGGRIFIDGTLYATTREPDRLRREIVQVRRRGELSTEINVSYNDQEHSVIINTDGGRVRRPLIIVKDGRPLLTKRHVQLISRGTLKWSDLIKEGIIEYLDAEEEENTYIALWTDDVSPEHTHLEITPAAILGICASVIPFAEHNQSPRNTYEAGMTKQAIGLYASNFKFRADRRSHLLQNPQRPLVGSRALDIIGYNQRPSGQNMIVAFISYYGWNIEDAIIINKASIERGLARSHFFRSYVAEEKKYLGGLEDRFEIPQKGIRGYRAPHLYRHLSEADGIVEPESEVTSGDVLIGRTSRSRFIEEFIDFEAPTPQRRESSIAMRAGEQGVVDSVILTETTDLSRLVKVKVRDQRIPELGDKFASRHGQKGVIGYIAPQEDLPFTEDGIVPDLIINPHAIPSRMTVGQILESMAAIIAAMTGRPFDATVFEGPNPDEITETLRKLGFHPKGETVMYDGITGQMMTAKIFIGPTYYQKLHHLAADKMHARARGPVQILTRQPTEGRAREGGLRFGEMERDVLVAHGTALLLKERLIDESDRFEVYVCESCGLLSYYDARKGVAVCPACGPEATVSKIAIAYAFKLLLQELMSLMIKPSIITKHPTEDL